MKDYANKFEPVLKVANGGITVSKSDYASVLGEEAYARLQSAHREQLEIDQAIGLAAAKVGYAHIKENMDVASIPVTVKQYGTTDKVSDVNRAVSAMVKRETMNPGTNESKPGGLTIRVETKIKGSGFKTELSNLANQFFG